MEGRSSGMYFVTYCKQGTELGSNPLEHACLYLSCWPGVGERIRVINAWGFYAQKNTNDPISMIQRGMSLLKEEAKKCFGLEFDPEQMAEDTVALLNKATRNIGFNFDLIGNHGSLIQEKLRFFDQGKGLTGITFHITKEQVDKLINECEIMMKEQDAAIAEAKVQLKLQGIDNPTSREILQHEEKRANDNGCESRLKRFEIKPGISSKTLITFGKSNTCKTMAVGLLAKIGIDQAYLADIQKRSRAFPRFSGKLEPIYLHSRGALHEFQDDKSNLSLFRQWQDGQLYWTLPPQLLVTEDARLDLFKLPSTDVAEIKLLVSKLQLLEKLFEHEALVNGFTPCKRLVKHIRAHYINLSLIGGVSTDDTMINKVGRINNFFNNLYYAMCENWDDEDEPETIVARLPEATQMAICKIVGGVLHKYPHETLEQVGKHKFRGQLFSVEPRKIEEEAAVNCSSNLI